MVTVEHHHQNTSASPPHEPTSSEETPGNSMPIEMPQNQVATAHQDSSDPVLLGNVESIEKETAKSAVSQRSIDLTIAKKTNTTTQDITRKVMKLDLMATKDVEDSDTLSPKSPVAVRLQHQTSLTSSVDVEDRKTLREALYQGIFHRHRRTIFAVGSFLRMLRSRNSQYNTIRSSSDGEDINEAR